MTSNVAKHAQHPPGSLFFVTIFNKDIIDCDTLLLTVSPKPIWHPLEKMICSRGWSQDKICPSILKRSSNREAHWPRDRSSWNSYVNTFPLSVSPSNYSQDAGDDSCPIETSNAGINLTLWYLILAPMARTRKHRERYKGWVPRLEQKVVYPFAQRSGLNLGTEAWL